MNLRFLTLLNTILAIAVTSLGLYHADTPAEQFYAIAFSPLIIFFGMTTFKKDGSVGQTTLHLEIDKSSRKKHKEPVLSMVKTDLPHTADLIDSDKRAFLKMVGATGISLLLYTLFQKKGPISLMNAQSGPTPLTDSTGKPINPREKLPTDGYHIAQMDNGLISYYGFTNNEGGWYIIKEDSETGAFRYAKGDADFAVAWEKREEQGYDYFNNVF